MSDPYHEYWREAAQCAIDEAGVNVMLLPEQWDAIAKSLQGSHECYGMAFGHECIPNPLQAEVRARDDKLKRQEASSDAHVAALEEALCRRMGVRRDAVWVEYRDGQVSVQFRR